MQSEEQQDCSAATCEGKKCRLKFNGIQSEIECVHFSKPSAKKKLVATGATLTTIILLVSMGVIFVMYRSDKKEKENQLKM
ncbi:uncharacterized protein LOC126802147 [Argentina anserina]|uniref:uncharacterized protein LOC126802147 n=1 Tax=Argentina anserina TaxID=57926 RepID=UPI002176361C|nr:uncharacterized protein LOC126802147 [Potentilla anserina]